ncbi:MAG: hypothetical protein AABZ06_11710 [Bdellovibrionota bacterium]
MHFLKSIRPSAVSIGTLSATTFKTALSKILSTPLNADIPRNVEAPKNVKHLATTPKLSVCLEWANACLSAVA